MGTTYRTYEPNQLTMLPEDIREWLPKDHLAFGLSEIVDSLDLQAFHAPYEGGGRRNTPYHPAMMVKVLIYGYATGVRSSRQIARKLHEDVAFRVLGAKNFPAHRTICGFRQRHLSDFQRLFEDVVRLAVERGLIKYDRLAVDGSKVRANASKRKAMSHGRMQVDRERLRAEIEALLRQVEDVDAAEDAKGKGRKAAAAKKAKAKAKRRDDEGRECLFQAEKVNATEDSKGKGRKAAAAKKAKAEAKRRDDEGRKGPRQAEKVNASEDSKAKERGDALRKEVRRRQDRLKAIDDGLERLEERQRKADEADGRKPDDNRKRPFGEPEAKAQVNFTDPESRIMKTSNDGFQQCYNAQVAVDGENQLIAATSVGQSSNDQGQLMPMVDEAERIGGGKAGEVLADTGYCNEADLARMEERGVDAHVAVGREKGKARAVNAETLPATARMAAKLRTEAGREAYARRKWLVEAPFGWLKEALGFRRFSVRGIAKVSGEWALACLSLNLRRMVALGAA